MSFIPKETIRFGLDWATTHIQEIESSTDDLHRKQKRIEWQLLLLLNDVVLALPRAMREQAQACIQAERRLTQEILDEMDPLPPIPEKASPECLPAPDSL